MTWMAAFAAPAHCQRAARKPWKAAPALRRSGSVSCYPLQFLGCPQPQCDRSCIAGGVGDNNRIADQLRHQQGVIINRHAGRTSPCGRRIQRMLDNAMLAARSYVATVGFCVFGGATIPASLIMSTSSRERNHNNDLGQLLR